MRYTLVPAAMSLSLVACTSTAVTYPEAVLQPPPGPCEPNIDLQSAVSLEQDRIQPRYAVSLNVDDSTACVLAEDGANTPYVLFDVSGVPDKGNLIVGGGMEQQRIFAPNVSTLDESGVPVRQFDQASFLFRNAGYSVQIRPRAGERYILVAAAPQLVGQAYDSIETGVSASSFYTPYGTVVTYSGVDQEKTRPFSYQGWVNAIVLTPKSAIDELRSRKR